MSSNTISKLISGFIISCYQLVCIYLPEEITAHSARAQAAFTADTNIGEYCSVCMSICRVGTWSSIHMFTKHYILVQAFTADAAVGTAVLQASLLAASSSPSNPNTAGQSSICGIPIHTSTQRNRGYFFVTESSSRYMVPIYSTTHPLFPLLQILLDSQ